MTECTTTQPSMEDRAWMARIDESLDSIERLIDELAECDPRCKHSDCCELFEIAHEDHDRLLDLDHVDGGLGLQVVCDVLEWVGALPSDGPFSRGDLERFVDAHHWPETGDEKIRRFAQSAATN